MNSNAAGASPVDATVGRPAPQREPTAAEHDALMAAMRRSGRMVERQGMPHDPECSYRTLIERLRCFEHPNDEGERLMHEAAAALARLSDDLSVGDDLRERMADILSRTAVALRGPEPPLTRWSWHDLPERAAAAVAAADDARRKCSRIVREAWPVHGLCCADSEALAHLVETAEDVACDDKTPNVAHKLPAQDGEAGCSGSA